MLGSPIHITPAAFSAGWGLLQDECGAARARLRDANSTAGVADAWTALSTGRLASLATVTLHRAQRLNRLTAAALFAHPQYGLFGDKDVDPYRVWRIFPFNEPARQVLYAVRADIEILRRKVRELGLDLRAQMGDPGSPLPRRMGLFFGLTSASVGSGEQLRRAALRKRDIQALTTTHFNRPANIGRHFFCSAMAAARTDVWLIAVATGHGHIGAEVFCDSMAVAPIHALAAVGGGMDWILTSLALCPVPGSEECMGQVALSPCPAPSLRSDPYLHPRKTGGGRILPPFADSLTLTALVVVDRVWQRLVSTAKAPELADGEVVACMASLDGIHPADLLEAQAQIPGALFTTNQVLNLVWKRSGCAGEILLPLCARTIVAINAADTKESICSDRQMRLAGAWIRGLSPEVTWPVDDREAFLAFCAFAQRWHRFHEAPSTLAASSRAIYAAAANRESVLRLADDRRATKFDLLPFVPVRVGISRERVRHRAALADLKRKLGKQGNTEALNGEEQKRSRELLKAIRPIDTSGDIPAQRVKEVLEKECEFWIDAQLRAIGAGRQYSSLANYGARVFDGLNLIAPGDDMSMWPAPDFVHWFERVEQAAKKANDDEGPNMAGVRRFLLVGRDRLGWDVPDELLVGVSAFKTDGQRKAAASTLVFSFDYANAHPIIQRRLADWPLLLEPARIDLRLREAVPMRSGERSTLLADCITAASNRLMLQNVGHSDKKSEAGVRLCELPADLQADIRKRTASEVRRESVFLFLDEDGADWTTINAIDQVENETLMLVTGDPSFRPHCCRASSGCNIAWSGWERTAEAIYHGRSVSATVGTPPNLKFNQTVKATLEIGQGHVSTFLAYYASVWTFLRAITVNAQLRDFEPDNQFIADALGNSDAVRQALARARRNNEPFSAWDVIGRVAARRCEIPDLQRKQPLPVIAPDVGPRNQAPTQEAISRYVLARATGTPRDQAAQRYGIATSFAQSIDLEIQRRK